MIPLLVLAGAFTLGYLYLLTYYSRYFKRAYRRSVSYQTVLPFCSVIIAMRNEEGHVASCLRSVTTQTYPRDYFEVIVVNDGSEDDTVTEVLKFSGIRLLHTTAENAGKKNALLLGIEAAKGEIIVTTDGDCIVRDTWLKSLVEHFDTHVQMVTGPVRLTSAENPFTRFQALDIEGLQVITAAGIESGLHHLANGANMAFRRKAFETVGGFSGNAAYASGDDVFLVQAIAKEFPKSVLYAASSEAAALTDPCHSVQEFIQQRIRWATKNSALRERSIFWIWIFIWLTFAVNLVVLSIAMILQNWVGVCISLFVLSSIVISEYTFLKRSLTRHGDLKVMRGFLLSFVLHYSYVLYIGLMAVIKHNYVWKGRTVR